MRPMLRRRAIRIVIFVSSTRSTAATSLGGTPKMAQNNLTSNPVVSEAIDASHTLGSFLTSWYHSPELQQQYHGDINVALQANGFDTHAPNFINEFRDASELATHNTASSSFEGTHQTAIDVQSGPVTVDSSVHVPAAPAPAFLATPAPVFVAPESHGDPVAQQLQAISNNYVTYTTEVHNQTDARQFNTDNSHTNNITADHGNVHFTDNSNTNTVNGDHAFGVSGDDNHIRGVATGDGAVAAGHNAVGATGDHSIAGEHVGVANTGDGAVVGEHIGAANTGTFTGTQVGGPVHDSNLQTITGHVDGIAAQDTSFHGPVNTGDADRGGVVNNGINGPANTLTGGVGAHSNVNLGGDQHVLQGDGNVGVAQGDHAHVDQDHSSIATNGSESGPALDASHGGSIAFGSGAQSANANIDGGHGPTNLNQFGQQAVSDHGPAQVAGHDLVNQTADGAHGPVAFGGGDAIDAAHNHGALSFGGDATNADHGGIANHDGIQAVSDHGPANAVGGDQAFAQDHSAASLHGDATAQNVDHLHDSSVSFGGDSQNFSHTDHTAGSIGGDALNQDHNHDTAGVAGHGDALVDNSDHSQVDDHSQHDYSSHYSDSFNSDDHSDHIHDSYNTDHSYNDDSHDHHVDVDANHHSDVDIHHA
jgi:hypothetical protein